MEDQFNFEHVIFKNLLKILWKYLVGSWLHRFEILKRRLSMMSQFMGPWQINGIYRNEVGWLTKRVNTECRCNIVKQVSRTFPTLFEPLLKYLGYLRLWGYCIFYCFKKVCFSEFQSIVLLFSQFTE